MRLPVSRQNVSSSGLHVASQDRLWRDDGRGMHAAERDVARLKENHRLEKRQPGVVDPQEIVLMDHGETLGHDDR